MARLFKGKYFPTSDILSAKKRDGQSFVWRSLLWGCDLLDQGIRKRGGDGRNILALHDPWLPRESTFKVFTPITDEHNNLNVCDLIQWRGYWTIQKLRELFWEEDVKSILSIPICAARGCDSWLWHYTTSWEFTTKSAYKLFSSHLYPDSSASNNLLWWKFLWKLSLPNKVKLFMWKLFHNILPCNSNLANKSIMFLLL